MKNFLFWLESHPHHYMRIALVWMFASVLSPWRIPMLSLLLVINLCLLIIYKER